MKFIPARAETRRAMEVSMGKRKDVSWFGWILFLPPIILSTPFILLIFICWGLWVLWWLLVSLILEAVFPLLKDINTCIPNDDFPL